MAPTNQGPAPSAEGSRPVSSSPDRADKNSRSPHSLQATDSDPWLTGSPPWHLTGVLKYLGLIALEAPAVAPIARAAAREVALALAGMRRIGTWSPIPTETFFRELPPTEVARLMGIGGRHG
jgi:hypothetical protein